MYIPIQNRSFDSGLNLSSTRLSPKTENALGEGSWNTLFLGDGYHRAFRGFASQGANTGSRLMRPIGKTWGGIKDIGLTQASGNVSEEIRRSLWGIGSGQVHIEGTNITGFTLSTLLQLSLLSAGVYQTPLTAGLPQPSAPEIGVSTETGDVTGSVSAKIEVWRPATGGRSRASNTSAVVIPQGNKVRLTFPLIGSGTHWRVYFTLMRFGGEGIHYVLAYNGSLDIPESVVAAGTVDGIARSLLFNWKDGDLQPDEASYDDYSPQAGTHLIRLENVMNVCGSLADSVSAPTSTNTGTAIQVSKPNNYESYIPTHLLFVPEQIVDVLSRPVDGYGLIGCENSIHALQYVGERGDELPACTITTILPDIGIKYAHNWTHFRGRICLYTAEGNLLMMTDTGEIDETFSAPIRRFIQNWNPANTIVGYCPKNDCIVIGNGKTTLSYSLETGEWTAQWLPDYGINATVLSCQSAKRRLYISMSNGNAYEFDNGASAVPVSFATNYTNSPNAAAAKHIFQMNLSLETNYTNSPVVVCINKNLQKFAFRQISATNANSHLIDAESSFSSAMIGKQCVIFANGINGAGSFFLSGYVGAVTGTNDIQIVNASGVPINAQVTQSDCFMMIGDYIETETFSKGAAHLPDFFPVVNDAKSYAVGAWFLTNDETGSLLDLNLFGTMKPTNRV